MPDSHLANSLKGAWPGGFPLSLCRVGDNLLICGGRLPHAMKNSCFARCTSLSCWSRGKFDKHRIVSPCAPLTLMCSPSMSDTSLSLVYKSSKNAVDKKKKMGRNPQCVSCHAPTTASKLLFCSFSICSETTSSSNFAEFLFILVAVIS